ncbi:MAG: hypothetical protein QF733_04850 [Phycisphaerales bacterium]|jgi:hypothetical protein|nr:hypothetical protein [Phycisphaerales bacterium]
MNSFVLQLRRFGVRLTADRRRFAILCTLMAVALLFWTRLIVIKRIPRTALADPEVLVADAEEAGADRTESPVVTVVLPDRPSRDPFAIDAVAYPEVVPPPTPSTGAASQSGADPRTSIEAMRLEASMPPSIAVIDGATRRIGDRVSGSEGLVFEVLEIRPKTVVLGRLDARYLLRMD